MKDPPDRRKLLTAVRARLAERGWSDPGGAVRSFVDTVHQTSLTNGERPSGAALAAIVPPKLVAVNATDADTIASALTPVVAGTPGEDVARPLIAVDEIDSFGAIRTVSAASVADIAGPLALPELTVKRFIASILGEAYVPKDWGGEGNDLFRLAWCSAANASTQHSC